MAFGLVGVAGSDEPLDEADDLRDVRRDARLDVGRGDAERRRVGMERLDVAGREHADLDAFGLNGVVDPVVDVRDVARVDEPIRAAQQAREHVENHVRPHVADVGIAVDRRAADVHRDALGILRLERLALAGQRVVR